MSKMEKSHICWLFVDLFLILASLGLIITSIVTDYWYEVDASAVADVTVQKNFSYTLGMWRKCYKMGLPEEIDVIDRQGDCVLTYKDLIKRAEDNMPAEEYKDLSLERSWIALMITAGAFQLFTILTVVCGLMPGDCNSMKRYTIYIIATLLSLTACLAGIASGVCFIALRDREKDMYPTGVETMYRWSFILGWAGTGLCLVEGFIFLGLLRMDYEDENDPKQYVMN